ncbi:Glycerol-3-phosphate dehydrogenase, mitochondrial [Zancudomyces culisetae]|uniref:Glycerol-3-phosphate dehydrogenase n=1 Tax=Zancudomyces culisetae TaxID=1213189 RepID=A0A1R1PWV1_ZANCU|nr:Glycerol-3-phosphate dehydrogenase, mitochondrial [Zancudomyces culisetae]|eukprot:OMH85383.1 Glycerol-3-phosphate dehydrogenase, mitochondrial [Zancudomyces culisetae]
MLRGLAKSKTLRYGVAATAAGYAFYKLKKDENYRATFAQNWLQTMHADSLPGAKNPLRLWEAPSRSELIKKLKNKDDEEFDLLIIGGGATGAGCAVDAASRGLKVAMVERDDFSAGTSSKSTKLIHGGVRYLQAAIMNLDKGQWDMVKEALQARRNFLDIAPHLSREMPILLPVYAWWKLPYYWIGCKMYDLLSGSKRLSSSYFLLRQKTIQEFPTINDKGLVGSIIYHDGMQNDSKMNVSLVMTAAAYGATVANKVEVVDLVKKKNEDGKEVVRGAILMDKETGEVWEVKAKGVINATGPFTDKILQMDQPHKSSIVVPSSGVHLVIPPFFAPKDMGLLEAETSDGRVIFMLPWEGKVLAGTTDKQCEVRENIPPTEEEIRWIVKEVNNVMKSDVNIREEDILSAWSGIRPLVRDPKSKNTKDLVRNHVVFVSDSEMVTIAGGKWTTYREMANETIDEAVKLYKLDSSDKCRTLGLKVVGAESWDSNLPIKLIHSFGLDEDIATNLSHNYGDRAWAVCALGDYSEANPAARIHPRLPYLEAEVEYAANYEFARGVVDVISRRTRMSFVDAKATRDSIPKIIDIMAATLNWSSAKKEAEFNDAVNFMESMGLKCDLQSPEIVALKKKLGATSYKPNKTQQKFNISALDVGALRAEFSNVDHHHGNGQLPVTSIANIVKESGVAFDQTRLDNGLTAVAQGSSDKTVGFSQILEILSGAK